MIAEPPPSPCSKVCTIDRETGWCIGCFRTGAEIGAWPAMDAAAQHALLAALPARAQAYQAAAGRRRKKGLLR